MRTTVNINDRLLSEAKIRAAETHRSLGEVIEDALRVALQAKSASSTVVALPSFSMGETLPGVDLNNSAALLELMERRD